MSLLWDWCISQAKVRQNTEPAGCCPEGLKGGTVHPLYDLHAITNLNKHTVMNNKHACLWAGHSKALTPQQQEECYIFITDVIDTQSPQLFGEYWLLSRKGRSGRLIHDRTESLRFRQSDNNTETADANCERSALVFKAALGKSFLWTEQQVIDVSSSQSGAAAEKDIICS